MPLLRRRECGSLVDGALSYVWRGGKKEKQIGERRSWVWEEKEKKKSRFWGVFINAVHRAFVLGLGARHRGIVEL
jgi:hypothetical protein